MQFSANNMRRRHTRQRGTSLVEVLIVLVILVVGIFSIARLFPGGFFAVRSAENNTFADRLAQAQLETLKQNDAFLLDAVYMYTNSGGFIPGVGPDDLTGTTASPYQGDATLNDVNKARYIQGETFNVPTANTGPSINGVSIHTLNYGPVQLLPGSNPPSLQVFTSPPPGAPPSIAGVPSVHSAPWTAKAGNSLQAVASDTTGSYDVPGGYELPGDLYTAGQPNYAIDYTGQKIAVPPTAYPQYFTFVLKRQVTATGGATSFVTFYYPLLLPASYDGGWFDPTASTYASPGAPNGEMTTDVPLNSGTPSTWSNGAATLYRTLSAEAPGGSLSATLTALLADPDPYKYVLLDPDPTLTNVSLGMLAFNPRIAGQQVSVSYLAYNWHIIHEDQDVPDTPGTPIRLTLNHIKRVGDVQSDQTIYNGVFRNGDASVPFDVVLLDTDTGDTVGLSVTDTTHVFDLDNTSGSPTVDQVAISYDGGRITLPTDSADAWASTKHKHLRIYYEGDLDWAVAIQKAPSLYVAGDPTTQVGAYQFSTLSPGSLLFPACDAGKVVEVDGITYFDKVVAPNPPVEHQVAVASGTITSDYKGTNYVDLTPYLDSNFDPNSIQIGAVRGVSARAVVIWKERTDWKSRSLDTILTRTQQ